MELTYLRNPTNGSREVSILPEDGDTERQVLEKAASFAGTVEVTYFDFLGTRTLEEVVVTLPAGTS